MIQVEVTDYQPGTGTRYLLIHGQVLDPNDMMKLSCGLGDLYIAYDRHGSYTFNSAVVPGYLAEKYNIQEFMLDAIALTNFIKVRLGRPIIEEWEGTKWKVCDKCGLPFYLKNEDSECYCKKYPMY